MNDTQTFFKRIAATQDELLARVSTVPGEVTRLAARAPRRAWRLRFAVPVLVTAGAAAAVAVAVTSARPLTFEVAGGETSFSDGSTMKLAEAASARVLRVGAHGAAIRVERGRAQISVVPRRGNDWAVEVGPFHVAVKGTRFSLAWDPETERFDFDLEKGKVVITAPCFADERVLLAGESLHASCRKAVPTGPASEAHGGGPAPTSRPEPAPPALEPAPAEAAAVPRAHAAPWRQLASAQRYDEALAAAERSGFAAECRRRDAADLLILGDVARLAGSPARAEQAYKAARGKRAAADRSTFGLGLVAFDQRRDYRGAAAWFTTYLREQPRGPLAEQAEGRLMDAWQRAGEPARAREAGQGYLGRYPHGPYADLARRLTLR